MHLTPSQNTCSMTELCGIYADDEADFKRSLKTLLTEAKNSSRKMIVANMHKSVHEQFGKVLEAAGFVHLGRYLGNSQSWVHMYVYGLEKPEIPKVVPVVPVAPKVRKPLRSKLALRTR